MSSSPKTIVEKIWEQHLVRSDRTNRICSTSTSTSSTR